MFPRFVAIEVLSLALGFLLAGVELTAAHMNYDENPAASACCGGNDCRPVEVDAVQWDDEKKGWHVDWEGDSVFVPRVSALPSPDDDFHGCGNRTRGLFGATGPLPPGAARELEPWRICFLVPASAMRAAFADLDHEGRNAMHELLASAFPALRRALGSSAPGSGNGGGTGGGGRGEGGRQPPGQDPLDPTPPAELEPGSPPSVDAVVPLPATAWLMVGSLFALLRAGRRAHR